MSRFTETCKRNGISPANCDKLRVIARRAEGVTREIGQIQISVEKFHKNPGRFFPQLALIGESARRLRQTARAIERAANDLEGGAPLSGTRRRRKR